MSSPTTDSNVNRPVIVMISMMVLLSIVPSLLIAVVVVHNYRGGRPPGWFSSEYKSFKGFLKDGEFWFGVGTHPDLNHWRITRMNLQSGVETETGLNVKTTYPCFTLQLNGEVYFCSRTHLCKAVEGTLQAIAPVMPRAATFWVYPFWYDGTVSMVVETPSGEYQLQHLRDGKWIDGRKILLPGPGRVWCDDLNHGGKRLLPLTSARPDPLATSSSLEVLPQGAKVHLFVSDHSGFYAYRQGFEFSDEPYEAASALAPQNSTHEVSGWEIIPTTLPKAHPTQMACDQDGPFFIMMAAAGGSGQIVRRHADGQWKTYPIPAEQNLLPHPAPYHTFLSDSSTSESYLVISNQRQGTAAFHRIENNQLQPAHLKLTGYVPAFLTRWWTLVIGLAMAWLLHVAVVGIGFRWLACPTPDGTASFETSIRVASISKRAIAFAIDLILMMGCLLLLIHCQLPLVGVHWQSHGQRNLSESIAHLEWALEMLTWRKDHLAALEELFQTVTEPVFSPALGLSATALLFTNILGLCCLRVYLEGRTGITPGKRIMGLQTVHSTLRPASVARILLRDLFYWIDLPLLITPLPATVSMLLSPTRQRIGDRIADTIVVDTNQPK